MLCRGADCELVLFAFFVLKNTRQRIVFSRAFRFISQELLDLSLMTDKKRAIKKHKAARFAGTSLFARRANRHIGGTRIRGGG